jgi:hypothetical protein
VIISHYGKYIFLHCRKVAGSSMTAYLNRYLGPMDIQVGSWSDTLEYGGRRNLRFFIDAIHPRAVYYGFRTAAIKMKKGRPPIVADVLNAAQKYRYQGVTGRKAEQPTAMEIQSFNPRAWQEYYKFCFVRNPFDRAVSDYRWRTAMFTDITFLEFLERMADPSRPDPEGVVPEPKNNWSIYTIDDRIAVDFVGRYESLLTDFEHVCSTIGIPFNDDQFPKAKSQQTSSVTKPYREYYGQREEDLVRSIFEKEIKEFNYKL